MAKLFTFWSFSGGDNGNGVAIISSLRPFDRELQKSYAIPIEIKDNGAPAMTGTSTLTVTIGDVNDNKMQPGSKSVLVYNYQGQSQDTPIGRVYVNDPDDWDVPDKKYYWEAQEHQRFKLDTDTGILTMRAGTRRGRYQLRFKVSIMASVEGFELIERENCLTKAAQN